MFHFPAQFRVAPDFAHLARSGVLAFSASLALFLTSPAPAQSPAPLPQPDAALQASPAQTLPSQPSPLNTPVNDQTSSSRTQPSAASNSGSGAIDNAGITEEELRSLLIGKQLFLRGGYLNNTLSFNEHGALIGQSPQGSFTLSAIEIDKVRLIRRKVELEGTRYGLRFLDKSPDDGPADAFDRVNITPKKKTVRITVDRERLIEAKQKKVKGKSRATASGADSAVTSPAPVSLQAAETEPAGGTNGVTTATSPAHATNAVKDALDNIFAQGIDSRMLASLPEFWKIYFQAATNKTEYRPQDPAVIRGSMVDKNARLLSSFEAPSNQFAQDHGVAGVSIYRVVIDAQGKPVSIAVARPIGFGLDENAVESIRHAAFEPAVKDGKPVPVALDLVVEFRIYSKRTSVPSTEKPDQAAASLPGPYSVQH